MYSTLMKDNATGSHYVIDDLLRTLKVENQCSTSSSSWTKTAIMYAFNANQNKCIFDLALIYTKGGHYYCSFTATGLFAASEQVNQHQHNVIEFIHCKNTWGKNWDQSNIVPRQLSPVRYCYLHLSAMPFQQTSVLSLWYRNLSFVCLL